MDEGIISGMKELTVECWAKKIGMFPEYACMLHKVLDEPEEAPYLLEGLVDGYEKLPKKAKDELRNCLIRVQIHCSINSSSDPINVSKQLYIAETMEKLLFGNNLLSMEDIEPEEDERKPRRKGHKKSGKGRKPGAGGKA